jgi:WD40 repeat protein
MVAHGERIAALDASGDLLVSGAWNGELSLWWVPSLERLTTRRGGGVIADVAFSPSGDRVAVARNEGRPLRTPDIEKLEQEDPRWRGVASQELEVWDTSDNRLSESPSRNAHVHANLISTITWVGDDLLSGSWDRRIYLWPHAGAGTTVLLAQFAHLVRDVAAGRFGGLWAAAAWGTGEDDPAVVTGRLMYPPEPSSKAGP